MLKIVLSSCIKMVQFVVFIDVPINGALIVLKWCAKDKGTMHEMPKNDDREPQCTFMYRALAILKLNIMLQRYKVVAYLSITLKNH